MNISPKEIINLKYYCNRNISGSYQERKDNGKQRNFKCQKQRLITQKG